MLTCFDVAEYFLSLAEEDVGDSISNLKLQKLVYYAQGFSLVILKGPLFPESIEAWTHGPVVPELYHRYKEYGSDGIPKPEKIDFSKYNQEVKDLLNEVWEVYGQFSAWKLRNMSHATMPWINYQDQVIPPEVMREYFSTLVDGN